MTVTWDRDYYGLKAGEAGVHWGRVKDAASNDYSKCRGHVLWVQLPGGHAVARVCARCHKTAFHLGHRSSYGDHIVGQEVLREGDSCPECSGRGGHDEERGDGMIVGWHKCSDCETTGRVKARVEDLITELGRLAPK